MRRSMLLLAFLVACSNDTSAQPTLAPITIGLITPKDGVLADVGKSFERVANLAVTEVNVSGGINGHELKLMVFNDKSLVENAAILFENMADQGVAGIIGPARSGSVSAIANLARDRKIPAISPSSTAQDVATNPDDDGGFVYRNVSNDLFQGLAMAKYLAQIAMPPVLDAVVVAEDSSYGTGLAASFKKAYVDDGGTTGDPILFTAGLDDAGAAAVVQQIIAAPPKLVVMIALEQDALKIVKAWDASGMATDKKFFFTDGARSMGFLQGLPASIVGSFGTAPTNPDTGDAYGVLEDRYDNVNADHVSDHVYAANVWDAVFLFAAALVQEDRDHPGGPYGGDELRRDLLSVSKVGQIYNAGQWSDLVAAIDSGADVDYDGASGPCNFDDTTGDAIGPYEVWQIVEDPMTHMLSFKRFYFLEAQSLEMMPH